MIAIGLVICISGCRKGDVTLLTQQVDIHTTYDLNSVAFANDSIGYICGGDRYFAGIVSRTTDGGHTWRTDSVITKALYAINIFSAQEAYIAGFDGILAYTNDSAKTFITSTINSLPVWHMSFRDRQHGVVACGIGYGTGAVYHTADGVASWSLSYSDSMHCLNGATYIDDTTVVVCGYGTVLRSTDGGVTFKVVKENGDFYQEVKFVNPAIGYAVGYQGEVIKTKDSGRGWEIVHGGNGLFSHPEHFWGLDFIDVNNGYAVGEAGLMIHTSDGGLNWQTVKPFTSERLRSIHLFSATSGIVVGAGGHAYLFQQ